MLYALATCFLRGWNGGFKVHRIFQAIQVFQNLVILTEEFIGPEATILISGKTKMLLREEVRSMLKRESVSCCFERGREYHSLEGGFQENPRTPPEEKQTHTKYTFTLHQSSHHWRAFTRQIRKSLFCIPPAPLAEVLHTVLQDFIKKSNKILPPSLV